MHGGCQRMPDPSMGCTRKWTTSQGICSPVQAEHPNKIHHSWCSILPTSCRTIALLGHQKQRPEIKNFLSLSRKAIKCVGKSKYLQSWLGNVKCWKQYFQKMGILELKWKKALFFFFSFQAQYSFICQIPHPCNTSSEFYIQRSLSF